MIKNPARDSISGLTPTERWAVPFISLNTHKMQRVTAYIDGFNLYFGLRSKGWKRFYWLNIQALAQQFIIRDQVLTATKYFTSVVRKPEDKRLRQATFLDALGTLPDFSITYGHYLEDTVTCRSCGHTYTTYHEKMTDVNISVEMLNDTFQNRMDIIFLISADSDLVAPIETVKAQFPNKRVIVIFPPGRHSNALKQVAHTVLHIGRNELAKSLLPDPVVKADGIILHCPARWH